jgi:hypothetical protein
MYKPSTYLIITYFPTYLSIYETYFLHNWLQRWNKIFTQLRFIHNWVIMGIQCMVSEKFQRHGNLIIFLDHIKQGWIVGGLPWNYARPQFHNPGYFKIVKKGCICSDKHFLHLNQWCISWACAKHIIGVACPLDINNREYLVHYWGFF